MGLPNKRRCTFYTSGSKRLSNSGLFNERWSKTLNNLDKNRTPTDIEWCSLTKTTSEHGTEKDKIVGVRMSFCWIAHAFRDCSVRGRCNRHPA